MAILYASGASWNTANNWGQSTGATDGWVPTINDDVVFDSNSVSMAIDTTPAVCITLTSTGYTGTLTQNSGKVLNASGAISWGAGTFSGSDAQILCVGLTVSGGAFTATTDVLTCNGAFTLSGGTWSASTGTVKVTANTTVNVGANSLYKFEFDSSTNVLTLSGTVLVTNTFAWTSGDALSGGTLELRGNMVVSSAFASTTSTIKFSGSAAQTITGNFESTVVIDKTNATDAVTLQNAWDNSGDTLPVTVTKGVLNIATYDLTVDGTFSVAANGTLKLAGSQTTVSTPTFASGGTCIYSATSGTITCQNWTYKNLTFDGSGGTFKFGETHTGIETFTVANGTFDHSAGDYAITCTAYTQTGGTFTGGTAALTVNGAWSLTTGAFTSTSGTLAVTGDFTRNSGTFTHNSGTVNFTDGDTTVTCTDSFRTVTINKTATTNKLTLGANITATNTITVTASTFDLAGFDLACTSTFSVDGTSFLRVKSSESSVKTPTLASGSTVVYYGNNVASAKTIKNWSYKALVFNDVNANKSTFNFAEAHTAMESMTVTSGTVQTAQNADGSLTCSGTLLVDTAGILVIRYRSLTGDGLGQTITAATITINASGQIHADYQGFTAGTGPGHPGGTAYTIGGNHGGIGGNNTLACYGSISNPTSLGSGGGVGSTATGGGAIILVSAGTITIDGILSANGGNAAGSGFAGAAGGSLNISAGTLAGSGTIRANGGSGSPAPFSNGGGGRISLNGVTTDSFNGAIQNCSYISNSHAAGYAGTIYLNAAKRTAWTIPNGKTFRLGADGINDYTFGSITIESGGILETGMNPNMNSSNGGSSTINCTSLDVQAGGQINSDAMGFKSSTGPGIGIGYTAGAASGGQGGNGSGTCYGSITNPINPGSGGPTLAGTSGGNGGSAIIISCSGTVTVAGTITANGEVSPNINMGSGSGGCVNIRCTSISGAGTIRVNGGNGAAGGGSGGGGRIAVVLSVGNTFGTISMQSRGGTLAGSNGAAGTIYTETATQGTGFGTLTIDNNSVTPTGVAACVITSSVTNASVGDLVMSNKGNVTINASQTLTLKTLAGSINVGSGTTLTNSGILSLAGASFTLTGTVTNNAGSTIIYTGSNTGVTVTLPNLTYKGLTINDAQASPNTYKFGETHTGMETFTVTAGTFSQSAGDYAIGCANYTQTGGTFTGGTAAITVGSAYGTFLLNGGAFTSTSGTLQINGTINPNYGYFTHTAGTFAHNNGTVTFYAGDYGVVYIDVPTSETFYILTLTCWNNAAIQLSGDTLIALNTLTITGSPGLNNVAVNNGTLEARGNVVIGALSAITGTAAVTFTDTANQTVTVNGGTPPSGTWTINKASGKVTLATNLTINTTGQDLVCTSGTLDLAGFNLTVNDAHSVASGFTLRLKGTETVSKTPTLASGSAVIYYGDNVASTKTCKNWTYKNLTINDTNANLSTFKFGETHTGMETFTVAAGTFSQSAGDYAITAASLIVNGGTFTGGTATVTVNGAGGQFTVSSGTFTAPNGTLALGAASISFAISISGTFNANSGLTTISSANASFTVNVGSAIFNNVTFSLPSAVITLTGTWNVDGNIVITPAASGGGYNSQFNGGTIQFSGNLTRTGGHVDSYFNGTTIWEANGSSQTITSSDGNPVCVACLKMSSSGTVNITESVYSRAGNNVTVWEYASGTINWTSTKTFTVANSNNSLAIITGGQSFAHLSMSSGNGAGAMTITGACNTGNLTVSGWQTMTCASGFNVGGNFSWATSPTCTAAVTFNGTGSQSITVAGTMPSGTVTVNKVTGTATLATNWTINAAGQDLICTAGTLDLAGFNLTVNDAHTVASGFSLRLKGIETVSKTPTLASGSTVEYYGDNVTNTKTCKNWSYKNLTFNDVNANLTTFVFGETHTGIEQFTMTAGIFSQAAGDYTITCSIFNLTGGTFTGGSAALTCNGNYSVATGVFTSTSGTLTITGHFSHASGTWNHNNGIVALTGAAQSITGSTNFYTLTKNSPSDTLSFSAGHTFAFASSLSLQGSAGNKLNIRSLTPGTSYLMTFPATRTLKNLDFADVENSSAANPVYAGECSRSGKTYGVIFPGVW